MSDTIASWAEGKLTERAVRVAKAYGCSADEALDYVLEIYPDLAKQANGGQRYIAKAAGVWTRIVEGAQNMVLKDGEDLSEEQRVDRFLKTDAGKVLYQAHREEQQARWASAPGARYA